MQNKRFLVAVLFCIAFTSANLYQETKPYPTNEIAKLLPNDPLIYVELRDVKDGLNKLQPWLAQFMGKEKSTAFAQDIVGALKGLLDGLPEKLSKTIRKAICEMQSLYIAIYDPNTMHDHFRAASVLDTDDSLTIIELFKVLAGAEFKTTEYRNTKIIEWNIGKHTPGLNNLYISALDKKLVILATHIDIVKTAIDRKEGKTSNDSLVNNNLFKDISATALKYNGFGLSFFFNARKFISDSTSAEGRTGRLNFDRRDAALGISKITGITSCISVDKNGKVSCEGRVLVEKGCPAYDIMRQNPSEKEILEVIPSDSFLTSVLEVNDSQKMWQDIKNLITENNKAFNITSEQFEKSLEQAEKAIGISIKKLVETLGSFELAIFIQDLNIMSMLGGGMHGGFPVDIGFALRVSDAKKLETTWKKLRGIDWYKKIELAAKKKDIEGVPAYSIQDGLSKATFCYAVEGNHVFFSIGESPTRNMIKLLKGGGKGPISKDEAVREILNKLGTEKCSSIRVIQTTNVVLLVNAALNMIKLSGAKLPDFLKNLSFDDASKDIRDVMISIDTDNGVVFKSYGSGLINVISPVIFMGISIPYMMWAPYYSSMFPNPPPRQETGPAIKLPEKDEDRNKFISKLVKDLDDEEPEKREEATEKLKLVGPKFALEHVKSVYKGGSEEAKSRAGAILLHWRAWDEIPDAGISKFNELWKKLMVDENHGGKISANFREEPVLYSSWYSGVGITSNDLEILQTSFGIKRLAEKLAESSVDYQRNAACLLTAFNSTAAVDKLLDSYKQITDQDAKFLVFVALGWASENREAKELITKALKGEDERLRQAAFCAIERTSDKEYIDLLIEMLSHKDEKVRFEAVYLLEKLTKSIQFNAFLSKEKRATQISVIKNWWDKSKKDFNISQPEYLLHSYGGFSSGRGIITSVIPLALIAPCGDMLIIPALVMMPMNLGVVRD